MGYSAVMQALKKYRDDHVGVLLGESSASWFAEAWGDIKSMLDVLKSDTENKAIAGAYSSGKSNERVPDEMKLDYICGIRRDVRKQFVSGEDEVFTDVTPFRHGALSAKGANIFDDALDQVLAMKEEQ